MSNLLNYYYLVLITIYYGLYTNVKLDYSKHQVISHGNAAHGDEFLFIRVKLQHNHLSLFEASGKIFMGMNSSVIVGAAVNFVVALTD